MRLIRYQLSVEPPHYGWVYQDKIGSVAGSPFGEYQREEATIPLSNTRLLAPVLPSKIICIGRNYVAHAKEHSSEVPEIPLIFLKPPSAIIGPDEAIVIPPQSQQIEHEAELAIVFSRQGRWITPDESFDYVLGYTIANDVTARDLQVRDGQWTRAKGFDTFCPIGPWIETEFDPSDAMITCHVNGEIRQMASTRDMVFPVRQLIAFISSVMTIEPGDILLTGTPSGVGSLRSGDIIEISIEGLGILKNPVVSKSSS